MTPGWISAMERWARTAFVKDMTPVASCVSPCRGQRLGTVMLAALSPETVSRLLIVDGSALPTVIDAEIHASADYRSDVATSYCDGNYPDRLSRNISARSNAYLAGHACYRPVAMIH